MKFNDFIRLKNLSKEDLYKIISKSFELKNNKDYKPFKDKTLAMIFEKPSTRTRISFETGFYQLGGQSIYLNSQDIQMGRGETIEDTARVLSGYVDMIMMRTFEHDKIERLAKYASIPVINGLSDAFHPCQVLSDIYSIIEKRNLSFYNDNQTYFNKINLLYIGDSNNVANSLIDICSMFGINIYIISPRGYEPNKDIFNEAIIESKKSNSKVIYAYNFNDINIKFDVIYTDVWISMGKETERNKRLSDLKDYQVNKKLIDRYANRDSLFMHCLPAHRGEEVTDEVIDSDISIVFDQATNRLHVQKAIMIYCSQGL